MRERKPKEPATRLTGQLVVVKRWPLETGLRLPVMTVKVTDMERSK